MVTPNEKIDAYLRRVRAGLRDLPQPEITDILNELRVHIVERGGGTGSDDAAIESVLQSLGSPEQIAALYVAENLVVRAESSRSPWTILRSLFYWATLSVKGFVVFLVCLTGYAFGACFLISALMKPIHPQGVGPLDVKCSRLLLLACGRLLWPGWSGARIAGLVAGPYRLLARRRDDPADHTFRPVEPAPFAPFVARTTPVRQRHWGR